MTTLRITVEWLDGRYHGSEWPPAPYRLYQAMLAGLALNARGDRVLEAAMRHLETLPPPVITAPPVDARTEGTAAVANNDADAALALHARGKPALARGQTARALTRRTRRARCVEGNVTYDWRATPETAGHYPALARIARSVTALGLGIDLALARVSLNEHPPSPAPGIRYAPAPAARRHLRVPWPGAFDALQAAYRDNRARIGADTVAGRPRRRCAPSPTPASSSRRLCDGRRSRFAPPTTGPSPSRAPGRSRPPRWCATPSDARRARRGSTQDSSPSSWATAASTASGSRPCPPWGTDTPTDGSGG